MEVRAAVDFDAMQKMLDSRLAALVEAWQAIRSEQTDDIAAQLRAAQGDPVAVASVSAPTRGGDVLLQALRDVTAEAGTAAMREAADQGVTVPGPDTTALESILAARAQAAAVLLARALSEAAARKASQLSGPTIDPGSVAEQTAAHLDGLSDEWLRAQVNGMLVGGMNAGRIAVMDAADAPKRFYSSALLDRATCARCKAADGREYASLAAVMADFPTGGRFDCLGTTRCRCSPIAVYAEAPAGE